MLISDSKFAPALRALAAGTAALLLLFAGPARAASLDDALIAARMGDTKEIVKLVERGLAPASISSPATSRSSFSTASISAESPARLR